MDLQTLANMAEVLGALTIVGGGGFALVQLREFRAQRRQAVAVELTRSFYSPDFSRAVELVRGLPDDCSAQELRAGGPELQRAAIEVTTTFESIGLIVYREMASYDLVRDLAGGIALVCWRKLERWTDVYRAEQMQPSWGEWFQWLALQLERDSGEKEARPAYVRHAGWRPRS